jgi:ABC-2 type transport system permease protein
MFKLIRKDLLIQKGNFLPTFVLCLAMIFFMNKPTYASVVYLLGIVAVVYTCMLSACCYDDKNGSELLLNSLPLRRRQIVLAKYLSVLVYAGLGLLYMLLTMGIVYVAHLPFNARMITLPEAAGSLTAVLFACSLFYPMYFYCGYIKAYIYNSFLFIAVFFLPVILLDAIKEYLGTGGLFGWLLVSLAKAPGWLQTSLLLAFLLLLTAVSIFISCRVYEHKDL